MQKAKNYANSKGYIEPHIADEFSSFYMEKMLRGRRASVDQLFADFCRFEYGDIRSVPGRARAFERRFGAVGSRSGTGQDTSNEQLEYFGNEYGRTYDLGVVSQFTREAAKGILFERIDYDRCRYRFHGPVKLELIFQGLEQGLKQSQIAEMMNVTESRISQQIPKIRDQVATSEFISEYHDDKDASKLTIDWITL